MTNGGFCATVVTCAVLMTVMIAAKKVRGRNKYKDTVD
jgi:hypothetical protein